MKNYKLLHEEIVYQNNSFYIVKRWYEGWHPELGILIFGWNGKETYVEKDIIKPCYTFIVSE